VPGDPVELGLVASLNRPAGNITAISLAATLTGKLLELLHGRIDRFSRQSG
jgi:hypothetical protein